MKFLFVLIVLVLASISYAKAFDQAKCIEGCNSDQDCIESCNPNQPEEPEEVPVVQNNTSQVLQNDSTITTEEEGGICALAILLIGLVGLVIRNAEREI